MIGRVTEDKEEIEEVTEVTEEIEGVTEVIGEIEIEMIEMKMIMDIKEIVIIRVITTEEREEIEEETKAMEEEKTILIEKILNQLYLTYF